MYGHLEQFLNKDNIKIELGFQDSIDNKVVLSHILWEKFNVFNNHCLLLFTIEQIDWALELQSSWYFFTYHSLLKQ